MELAALLQVNTYTVNKYIQIFCNKDFTGNWTHVGEKYDKTWRWRKSKIITNS